MPNNPVRSRGGATPPTPGISSNKLVRGAALVTAVPTLSTGSPTASPGTSTTPPSTPGVTQIIPGTGIGVSPGTGIGNVTVSYTGRIVAYAPTIALMRTLTAPVNNRDIVILGGYYAAGDGGGGTFWWESTSTDADDKGLVIKITAVATGRFYRVAGQSIGAGVRQGQTIDVRWFGAIPNGGNDCAQPTMDAYATFQAGTKGACLHFPGGNYLFNNKVTLGTVDVTIKGDGRYGTALLYNIAGAADSLLAASVICEVMDLAVISLVGTRTAVPCLNFTGSSCFVTNVWMKEVPNNYAIRHTGSGFMTRVQMETANGYCAFYADGGRPIYRHCECAMLDGLPVVIIRTQGAASITSAMVQGCYFKGGGPWGAYSKVGMVISAGSGSMNEGQLSDFTLDTGGGGNPVGSKSLLMEAPSSTYVLANWTLGDLWLNSGRCGLYLAGVDDAGASKTVRGIMGSNIITRPIADYGVEIDQCRSVKLTGLATIAVGAGAIGVRIKNGGANDSRDIQIQGCGSTVADFQCDYSVEYNGTKVKNCRVDVSNLNNTNAYLLSGAANKLTQDLVTTWPDAAGGMNFSGPVNQNV